MLNSEEKNSPPEKNNNSFSNSTESLLVQSTKKNPQLDDQSRTDASPQINLQFSEDDVKTCSKASKNWIIMIVSVLTK
ncbi:hypothetical protein [Wolbachia endosymbiont (group B) of Erebia ligea]|uniref:hypothetical protein n=1 Tax=Wolbachia endosymbiont (group B) of Erebia ligea TaxID=2954010 RepID=UPI0021F8C717|nr:hypothetical protein [Wolbachia endosymbiont (group B) of Erebia ligea]